MFIFDGVYVFLFEVKIKEDLMMIGSFFFGNYYKVIWEVKFVFDVMFRDFNEFIFLNEGYDWFNFFFLNMEGKMVFLLDEVY